MAAGILGAAALVTLIVAGSLLEQIIRPLQTLANVISALRESDYSFRARGAQRTDALGELALEINSLADTLQNQRLAEIEATALLRRVVSSMDAPVLAFDLSGQLRLINPAAERLLHLTAARAIGRSAAELKLAGLLEQPDQGVFALPEDGHPTQWMIRRTSFRQRGVPHTLLVLSDVSLALREQEREAWQRLIRVLGHEINNSLTPIKSVAGSLRARIRGSSGGEAADLERGLRIIEARAESLNRFIQAYRRLAQLPAPVLQPVSLSALLERAASLEMRAGSSTTPGLKLRLQPGPEVTLLLDPDQMEQLFINLFRNAVEAVNAALQHSFTPDDSGGSERGEVVVRWEVRPEGIEVMIEDNGIGLSNPANLFVPFYTTKPGGSGVGLALARQICEAHGGALELANRTDRRGCRATIRLPFHAAEAGKEKAEPKARRHLAARGVGTSA